MDHLELKIDKDISRMDAFYKGELLGTITNPGLLFDPLRKYNKNNDLINGLFSPGNVIVNYDNLRIFWNDSRLFPPSIDSMFAMKTFREKNVTNQELEKIIDIGTGTGPLGLYLLKYNPTIKIGILTDYQAVAGDAVKYNAELNKFESRVKFMQGDAVFEGLPSADLIVSNPPYIPETFEMKEKRGESVNPYQGTSLIEKLIRDYCKVSKRLILHTSSLCAKEVKEYSETYHTSPKIISTMTVPARLTFTTPEHRKFLVEDKRINVKDAEQFIKSGIDTNYWPMHELFELEFNNT